MTTDLFMKILFKYKKRLFFIVYYSHMKMTIFSDTHNQHSRINFSSGDILIFCGDLTTKGALSEVSEFSEFIKNLNYRFKIVIAGNHDFCFEDQRKNEAEKILTSNGIIYLNDSGIEIEGIKFWGSPIQPWYHDWAFNRPRGIEINKHWNLIPDNTNVLITHGPPYGILDLCKSGERVGCHDLLECIKRIKPEINAFGHIHESYGTIDIDGVKYVNASSLNKSYTETNSPIDLENLVFTVK